MRNILSFQYDLCTMTQFKNKQTKKYIARKLERDKKNAAYCKFIFLKKTEIGLVRKL